VRHPHVVPFIGASLESPGHCWLISEYMPGGSLSAWLHGSVDALGRCSRPLLERLAKALEVAKGGRARRPAFDACHPRRLPVRVQLLGAAAGAEHGEVLLPPQGCTRWRRPARPSCTGE
jgi:hypothetical protein